MDLRPLREFYKRLTEGMTPEQRDDFRRWVFGFDAARYVGRLHRATYGLNPGIAY